jgi:hypothetical protein
MDGRVRFVAALSVIFGSAVGGGCGSDDGDESKPGGAAPYCEATPAGSLHNEEFGCDSRCPGDASCKASNDSTLFVGAASEDITPVVDHVVAFADPTADKSEFKQFAGDKCVKVDSCDLNDVTSCTGVDPMLCTWIAGFGTGRPAVGNADPTSVRCAVLRQGNTQIGLCAVDSVGWFYSEVEQTRELIAAEYPDLELDFLLVAATHVHETQDTLGIWGPSDTESGVKDAYNELIRKKTALALEKAAAAAVPVRIELGRSVVDGHIDGTDPAGHATASFVSDTRDPVVIDNELRTMRFVSTADDTTVATLINFTSHPEFADDKNLMTSADYPGMLRKSVEEGLKVTSSTGETLVDQPGVGGVAIFFNGALGGQVGPGKVIHTDFEGNPVPEGIERAYNNGRLLAVYAHEALTKGVETLETVPIGFRARELYLDVLNFQYHIAIAQQLFHRDGYFYDPNFELGEGNLPSIRTQISVVDIGPAELLSIPGELHAELLLATKEGVSALDAPYPFTPAPYFVLNDPATNPNCETDGVSRCDDGPPAIADMDRTKILDLSRDPKATHHWVIGLGQDMIGYVVPEYDYKLHPQNPYLDEASPGNHYEETNSVGANVQDQLVEPILQVMKSPAVIKR